MDFASSLLDAMHRPGSLAAIAAAIFAAALIRGFTGFGFALAAVPLRGFSLPPSQCVPLAVALQFCASLADLPRARRTLPDNPERHGPQPLIPAVSRRFLP